MRLFKVRTRADLTIESRTIFGRIKKYNCYFTWNEKYIYAKDKDEAKMKYGDYFFSPMEDGYDKDTLAMMIFAYHNKSNNMNFNLKFNEKIIHTHEYIVVYEKQVTENIDIIKKLSTADDFRNWYNNGTNDEEHSIDEDWMFK